MDWLDIDKKDLDSSVEESDAYSKEMESKVGKSLEAGVHTVKVSNAYLKDSGSSDAVMLHLEYEDKDGNKAYTSGWVKNKEGKSFYVDKKTNKKKASPELIQFKELLSCMDLDLEEIGNPVEVEMEAFGNKFKVKVFKKIIDKKLKIGLQKYEDDYDDGEIKIKSRVIKFMDLDGKYKGDDVEEKVIARLEKSPLRKLKGSTDAKPKSASGSEESTVDEW